MVRIVVGNDPLPRTVWVCATFLARARGLLGRALPQDGGALIVPCRSIHTFGMRTPMDVVYLSRDGRVVGISRGLRPWRMDFAPALTYGVLEVAAGSTAAVALGDQVSWTTTNED
jgi:uncharacterized membrane protein (UPF0127 family)